MTRPTLSRLARRLMLVPVLLLGTCAVVAPAAADPGDGNGHGHAYGHSIWSDGVPGNAPFGSGSGRKMR